MDIEAIVHQVIEALEKREGNEENAHHLIDKENKDTTGREMVVENKRLVGVDHPMDYDSIAKSREITPARIGIGRCGTRMKTREYLYFRIDHAAAQDAVFKGVSENFLKEMNLPILHSKSKSLDEFLMNLDSGRILDEASRKWAETNLSKEKQVQIVISDGLSSKGIEANIPDLLPALVQGLKVKNITVGEPVFIKRSRVWIQDELASITNCDVIISLIGERPGLATSKSISAYLIYRPTQETVEADRTVISNIHDGGIPPVEAGAYLADLIDKILEQKVSGVKFAQLI
ncbi:ethanolamine ammonia-lyase subunit EutC [Alkalihalobacillus sp. BA299]|uniref:ethanolamine ammonia-lyase subunit EutC n=1 Tax=Alkalihalobacillus sp. BA299 TaxID=2815938 RepID=UPI001AD9EB81|nr:ethanolamine ammonia-lyase subunit EutC [Alkalihalobacillus sp. BA299]